MSLSRLATRIIPDRIAMGTILTASARRRFPVECPLAVGQHALA